VYRLSGRAQVGSEALPWRLILKALHPTAGSQDPTHIFYPPRELLLYRSGLLDELPRGLRAPRCYACDEHEDGAAWVWLECVEEDGERVWSPARWSLAARHLGRFNGAYLAGQNPRRSRSAIGHLTFDIGHWSEATAPWLGGRRLRSWLERHVPMVERIAAAPSRPEVSRFWPGPVVDALLRLWEERHALCDALEGLPQTFCHGDAIRRNLFMTTVLQPGSKTSSRNPQIEMVAIDWEYAGYMAPGEEIGQTVSVAGAFYDVDPAALPALDEALFAGYLAGLREAGWSGDERQVRFAYAAHAALRNAFNAVGAAVPHEAGRAAAQQRYGRSWEELAAARAAVRPFLLERAEEARRLLNAL
jgi:hypothetical protein